MKKAKKRTRKAREWWILFNKQTNDTVCVVPDNLARQQHEWIGYGFECVRVREVIR